MFTTSTWYPHWGIRRYCGKLGYQAAESCLTPEQHTRWQAAKDADAAASVAAAHVVMPLALTYAPNMVPAPTLQPDGTTLYAGETTALAQEPLIDLLGPLADGSHTPAGYGGSQCSTAATIRDRSWPQE